MTGGDNTPEADILKHKPWLKKLVQVSDTSYLVGLRLDKVMGSERKSHHCSVLLLFFLHGAFYLTPPPVVLLTGGTV